MYQPKYRIEYAGGSLQECGFTGQCTSGNLPAFNVVKVENGKHVYLGSHEHCMNYISQK
jgi:hypothetical protein